MQKEQHANKIREKVNELNKLVQQGYSNFNIKVEYEQDVHHIDGEQTAPTFLNAHIFEDL
jgi:hypothetical protein